MREETTNMEKNMGLLFIDGGETNILKGKYSGEF